MVPSSSLGATSCGLYEPIHGSAPDIAGQDVVNPIACILSAAMMLRYSFDMPTEADEIEAAVSAVLDAGLRTADISGRKAARRSAAPRWATQFWPGCKFFGRLRCAGAGGKETATATEPGEESAPLCETARMCKFIKVYPRREPCARFLAGGVFVQKS